MNAEYPLYVEIFATLTLVLFGVGFLLVTLCRPLYFALRRFFGYGNGNPD